MRDLFYIEKKTQIFMYKLYICTYFIEVFAYFFINSVSLLSDTNVAESSQSRRLHLRLSHLRTRTNSHPQKF